MCALATMHTNERKESRGTPPPNTLHIIGQNERLPKTTATATLWPGKKNINMLTEYKLYLQGTPI